MTDEPVSLGDLDKILGGSPEETEAKLDPNFIDDPDEEFLPQEDVDGIPDEEEN